MAAKKNLPARVRQKGEDFWEWLKSLFEPQRREYPRVQPSQPQPTPPAEPQPSEEEAGRYQVQNPDESVAHQCDSLGEALHAWREQTQQKGAIVDTETGEDITPEKEDNGRFVVLDKDEEQIGTFDEFEAARQVWESATNQEGTILDTLEKKNVTPYEGHLTDEEIQEAVQLVTAAGGGLSKIFSSRNDRYQVNIENVKTLIPRINKLALPIFKLSNAVGSGINVPTHTVKVTKREAIVEQKEVPYYEDVPIDNPPTDFVASDTPEDLTERRRIRNYDEVTRVDPMQFAMPGFETRYARKDLHIDEPQIEVPGEAKSMRVRRMRIEETITPREWEEEMEISDDERVQKLAKVIDLSGSMFFGYGGSDGTPQNVDIAVAIGVVLVTKHLRDDSSYTLRWFANYVDHMISAEGTRAKEKLIEKLLEASPTRDIGGGTNIIGGIEKAAQDVRQIATGDEIPEVLLITDGHDMVSATQVFEAIGTDVILHTIVINGSNHDLKRHSTTYEEVNSWQLGFGQNPYRY